MKHVYTAILFLVVSVAGFSQRPGGGLMGPGGAPPQNRDWTKNVDSNKDGKVDLTEFQAAIDATFSEIDQNGNGVIDDGEFQMPPRPEEGRPMGPPMGQGRGRPEMPVGPPSKERHPGPGKKLLPPFFFAESLENGASTTKADFEKAARRVFSEMDADDDGSLTKEESRPLRKPGDVPNRPEGQRPQPPPNARFIGAEMRFGDKLVKGQPFSAETVIEDTRRLFDGSTVTKQRRGAIYRDAAGRTRREQPLESIVGVSIVGTDQKPQRLVFINDLSAGTQAFLDLNNKIAHVSKLGRNSPLREPKQPENSKNESLGTKTIEGAQVEGTRISFEIPAGELGNDKPLQVVTETWFSNELQMVVYSRHVDPMAGEHVFRLVNIRRSEPSNELFVVPTGFKIENRPEK